MTLRWGILSTGGIAAEFTRDLQAGGHVVTAVGSRTAQAAERFGAEHGIERRHATYEELVADPSVDVVYIATPHPMHAPNALLAIAAGKHVLVEKPFTMTAAEARTVASAAQAAGVFCMEAMWTRFLPHIVQVRELIASGRLGRLVLVQADHGQRFTPDPAFRLFAPELGGGALLDLGVYPVSLASMVLGAPSGVSAIVTPAMTGVDATTSILLEHPGGAHAVLTCTSSAVTATRASIVGTEGRIEIEPTWYAPTTFTFTPGDGPAEPFTFSHIGRGMSYQADEVLRCVEAGLLESPVLPLAETIQIMATLEEVLGQAR